MCSPAFCLRTAAFPQPGYPRRLQCAGLANLPGVQKLWKPCLCQPQSSCLTLLKQVYSSGRSGFEACPSAPGCVGDRPRAPPFSSLPVAARFVGP